jgi:hypothetical protein
MVTAFGLFVGSELLPAGNAAAPGIQYCPSADPTILPPQQNFNNNFYANFWVNFSINSVQFWTDNN